MTKYSDIMADEKTRGAYMMGWSDGLQALFDYEYTIEMWLSELANNTNINNEEKLNRISAWLKPQYRDDSKECQGGLTVVV